MRLSDRAAHEKGINSRPRTEAAAGRWWGEAQKVEAAKTYLLVGSYRVAAAVVGIPEETLKRWSKSVWWKQLIEDFRQEDQLQLSARLKKLVDKSLSVVEDRLDKGDFVYDQKTGEMRRRPVNMRDAHKVALDMQERSEQLVNNNMERASDEQVADKLIKLAEKFAELAGAKKQEQNTIEVDVTDVTEKQENTEFSEQENENAVYEERETRLQAGECSVQLETGAEEESVGTDSCSPEE